LVEVEKVCRLKKKTSEGGSGWRRKMLEVLATMTGVVTDREKGS
jgi:hypothetical protein